MNALDLRSDAHLLAELAPPASLAEARTFRDDLVRLIARERDAGATFLLALSTFDRRRGWERLGHASLFAFLTRELGLSRGGAFFRLTAARLVQRFPEVVEPLRDGRLCITSVVELARVLTPENRAEVLPLFFGCSSREAREVAASLDPRPDPPHRTVVTTLPVVTPPLAAPPIPANRADSAAPVGPAIPGAAPDGGPVQSTEPPRPRPAARRTEVRPLTAELRRLHVTVSDRFLEKVSAARDGLSHVLPGATTEQVLEAAIDLLLERQARSKALLRRPRAARTSPRPPSAPGLATPTAPVVASPSAVPITATAKPAAPTKPAPAPRPPPDPVPAGASGLASEETPPAGRDAASGTGARVRRRAIPAAIEREVRLRDGGRCQYPLDAGGVCGSTWQVELDHVRPLALGGETTAANLRCACRAHNWRAAELALGEHARASARSARVRRRSG